MAIREAAARRPSELANRFESDCGKSGAVKRYSGPKVSLAAGVVYCSLSIACSDRDSSGTEEANPTLVEVDPSAFLGDVPCAPGALRTYVATLFDMTSLGEGEGATSYVQLPSSGPVPCNRSVAFGLVVHRHAYAVRIEGYGRDDLIEAAPGIPVLVDPSSREPVEPEWTTGCGNPPPDTSSDGARDRVVSEYRSTRRLESCPPLVRTSPSRPTVVEVGLDAGTCSATGVERFSVRRQGVELGGAACGETIELADLTPGEFVGVELLAYTPSAEAPSHGTTCSAKAQSGLRVRASCSALSSKGSIQVDVSKLLQALNVSCADVSEISLSLAESEATPVRLTREKCRGIASFAALAAGDYTVRASAVVLVPPLSRAASCLATVEPGLAASAQCAAEP
jgi:hypothetical protein